MISDMTIAKIGRSMKKWENIGAVYRLSRRPSLGFFSGGRGIPAAALSGLPVPSSHNLDRSSLGEAHDAVRDHLVAGRQTPGDKPVLTLPVTHLDTADLCLALGVHDPDEEALRALQHGLLRHQHQRRGESRPSPARAQTVRGAGPVRIAEGRANQEGAGFGAVVGIPEKDPAGFRVYRTVGQHQFDASGRWSRACAAPLFCSWRILRQFILGNAEVDPDGVELGDIGERAALLR